MLPLFHNTHHNHRLCSKHRGPFLNGQGSNREWAGSVAGLQQLGSPDERQSSLDHKWGVTLIPAACKGQSPRVAFLSAAHVSRNECFLEARRWVARVGSLEETHL